MLDFLDFSPFTHTRQTTSGFDSLSWILCFLISRHNDFPESS